MPDDMSLERRVDTLEAAHAVMQAAQARIGGEVRDLHGRAKAQDERMDQMALTVARMDERCTDVRVAILRLTGSITKIGSSVGDVANRLNELDKEWRKLAIATLAPALVAIALGLWALLLR